MARLKTKDGKQPNIGLDLGDTVFDRKLPRVTVEKASAMQLCDGAMHELLSLSDRGCRLSVISKIDIGHEARVSFSLFHAGLIPYVIDPNDIRFCHTRAEKGPIAQNMGLDFHVDDRIEVLNSMHSYGVPHKILFIGVRDERKEEGYPNFSFEGVHIASSWIEVREIIEGLCITED